MTRTTNENAGFCATCGTIISKTPIVWQHQQSFCGPVCVEQYEHETLY